MSKKIKIIIADDHQLFAEGIEHILSANENFEILAKVSNGKILLQLLNSLKPDIILLDINMPFMNGMEAAKTIKKEMPAVKIIFLSMYYDTKIISLAKDYRVNGFIIKTTSANDLKAALIKVMDGEIVYILPKELLKQNVEKIDFDFTNQYKLSPREIEIIQSIKKGKGSKEIAEHLYLSVFTIETHRKNIFKKLSISSVGQLISFAVDNNI